MRPLTLHRNPAAVARMRDCLREAGVECSAVRYLTLRGSRTVAEVPFLFTSAGHYTVSPGPGYFLHTGSVAIRHNVVAQSRNDVRHPTIASYASLRRVLALGSEVPVILDAAARDRRIASIWQRLHSTCGVTEAEVDLILALHRGVPLEWVQSWNDTEGGTWTAT